MVGWTRRNRESRERHERWLKWYHSLSAEARAAYDLRMEERWRRTRWEIAGLLVLVFLIFAALIKFSPDPSPNRPRSGHHVAP